MIPTPSNWRTTALALLSGALTFAALAAVGAALIYTLSTRGRIDDPASFSRFINPGLVAGFVLLYVSPGLVVGRFAFVRPTLHAAVLGVVIGLTLVLLPFLHVSGFGASPSPAPGLRGADVDLGALLLMVIVAAALSACGGWLGGRFVAWQRGRASPR